MAPAKPCRLNPEETSTIRPQVRHSCTERGHCAEQVGLHGLLLRVIEQGIDTATMEGRVMFGMPSVLAELQRELIVANTNDGLAAARGLIGGRRPKLTADQAALAQKLYDEREKTVQQIADLFSVPRSTVYGHLNRYTTTPPRRPKKTTAAKP